MFLVMFAQATTLTLRIPDDLHGDDSHQGPASVESEVDMSEEQYGQQSRRNVERWVAAHIIPVSSRL